MMATGLVNTDQGGVAYLTAKAPQAPPKSLIYNKAFGALARAPVLESPRSTTLFKI